MLTAITRTVGPEIVRCALSYLDRAPIDPANAAEQHRAYETLLRRLGVRVIALPALPGAPDAPFVEDVAVVLDALAIMTTPALASRQIEVDSVAEVLKPYRPQVHLSGDARLEGGDVLRVDRVIYVGLSQRTNRSGIEQLRAFAALHGYTVQPIVVDRCLHLKTAATSIGRGTVLANPTWVDTTQFTDLHVIEADPAEPFGGNALVIEDTVILPASAPRTASRLEDRGFRVEMIDISELEKAEAGLTCCSVIFRADEGPVLSVHGVGP